MIWFSVSLHVKVSTVQSWTWRLFVSSKQGGSVISDLLLLLVTSKSRVWILKFVFKSKVIPTCVPRCEQKSQTVIRYQKWLTTTSLTRVGMSFKISLARVPTPKSALLIGKNYCAFNNPNHLVSTKINANCAIKCIDKRNAPEDFVKKFLPRELEILPRLNHQNIVKVNRPINLETGFNHFRSTKSWPCQTGVFLSSWTMRRRATYYVTFKSKGSAYSNWTFKSYKNLNMAIGRGWD